MVCRQGFVVVLGLFVTCGCGGAKASDSAVQNGGNGGMAGAGGSVVLGSGGAAGATSGGSGNVAGATSGGSAGAAQYTGEPPTITLHACPSVPDAPCPTKAVAGDVVSRNAGDLAALVGVTAIEGKLDIAISDGLDNLSCLETVGKDVQIRMVGADGDTSLWGLRNLRSAGGGVDLTGGFHRMFIDCAFSNLQSLGKAYVTGGAVDTDSHTAGELDLSSLQEVRHIRIVGSELTRVKLPNNRMLSMGQLWFDRNPYLSEVSGFMGVTMTAGSGGANAVRIVENPRLSECRAQELAKIFTDAGVAASSVTIMNNLACTM